MTQQASTWRRPLNVRAASEATLGVESSYGRLAWQVCNAKLVICSGSGLEVKPSSALPAGLLFHLSRWLLSEWW